MLAMHECHGSHVRQKGSQTASCLNDDQLKDLYVCGSTTQKPQVYVDKHGTKVPKTFSLSRIKGEVRIHLT
jgi:hypothetical protein